MNGYDKSEFNLLVSSTARREILRANRDITLQKALQPVLKRWSLSPNKVTFQLRYYQYNLKPDTPAGDTEGAEIFVARNSDSGDKELKGFHPFINKASLKTYTQKYLDSDGWYLARESSTGNGQFSLAVTFKGQLRHFKINFSPDNGTYKVASKPFENLHELFAYYSSHSVKKTREGDIYLSNPIPRGDKAESALSPVHKPENGLSDAIQSLPVEAVISKQSIQNESKKSRPLPALPQSNPTPQLPQPSMAPPLPHPKQPSLPNPKQPSLPNPKQPSPLPPPPHSKINPPHNKILNIEDNKRSKTLPRKPSKGINLTKEEIVSRPLPPIPPQEEPAVQPPKPKSKRDVIKSPLSVNTKNKSCHNLSNIPSSPNSHQREGVNPNTLSPLPISPKPTSFKVFPIPQPSSQSEEDAPMVPPRGPVKPTKQPIQNSLSTDTGFNSNNSNCFTEPPRKNSVAILPPSDGMLPPGWTTVYSKSRGRNYYFNEVTSETKWTHPLAGREPVGKQSNGTFVMNRPVSPSNPSGGPFMRQRSQTSSDPKKPNKNRASPPPPPLPSITKSFSSADKENKNHPHTARSDSQGLVHSPEPSQKRLPVKANSFRNIRENKIDNEYDFLPRYEPSSVPTRNIASWPNNKTPPSPGYHPPSSPISKDSKLMSTRSNNQCQGSSESSSKHSAPVSLVQTPSPKQGRPIKVSKHTIPAPPPNIPQTLSTAPPSSRSPQVNLKSNPAPPLEATTVSSDRNNLMFSIQNANAKEWLKTVSPVPKPQTPAEESNSIIGILARKMAERNNAIQDSDQSDSAYEDADDEDQWSGEY